MIWERAWACNRSPYSSGDALPTAAGFFPRFFSCWFLKITSKGKTANDRIANAISLARWHDKMPCWHVRILLKIAFFLHSDVTFVTFIGSVIHITTGKLLRIVGCRCIVWWFPFAKPYYSHITDCLHRQVSVKGPKEMLPAGPRSYPGWMDDIIQHNKEKNGLFKYFTLISSNFLIKHFRL